MPQNSKTNVSDQGHRILGKKNPQRADSLLGIHT